MHLDLNPFRIWRVLELDVYDIYIYDIYNSKTYQHRDLFSQRFSI